MSTKSQAVAKAPVPVDTPLTMKEVAALLVRHYGLHEGKFDLLLEYQFGLGMVGPDKESLHPGVSIGFAKLGLTESKHVGPITVDASEVNPRSAGRKRKKI